MIVVPYLTITYLSTQAGLRSPLMASLFATLVDPHQTAALRYSPHRWRRPIAVARKQNTTTFEKALDEFEKLVASMEEGDLSLEDSLKKYERGMELSRVCQSALEEAEQRVRILSEKTEELEPLAKGIEDDE
jgi:exodeoxyribonuclease VII small subunit